MDAKAHIDHARAVTLLPHNLGKKSIADVLGERCEEYVEEIAERRAEVARLRPVIEAMQRAVAHGTCAAWVEDAREAYDAALALKKPKEE